MKRALVVSFKILLPLLFLYNIGFFSLNFSALLKDPTQSVPFDQKNNAALINFVNEKIRASEQKDKKYGPYDYFRDLHEIKKFEKAHPGTMGYHNMINSLMSLHSNNLNRRYFTGEDVSRARDYYEELENPGITLKNKIETEHFKKTWWPNLSAWLLKSYLKNLPLAFFLFLFWWYQEKKHLKVLNPLSFIVSLIFYPITVALIIKEALTEEGRYYFAEAELRRTKDKMFTMLSADEVADLRRFAKSRGLTLNDWRNYLGNQGFKPQGILISSLVVTILFMAIPKFSFSQSKLEKAETNILTTILTAQVNAPSGNINIAHEDDNNAPASVAGILDFFSYSFTPKNLNPIVLKAWVKKFHLQEVVFKIEHIPCFCF